MSGLRPMPVRAQALHERLAADLAAAITHGNLFLEYQPKFDCSLGKYTGVEALIRWHHPVYGQVPTGEFVVLAEEMGLIGGLTDWVVATATRQAADWYGQNIRLDVSVNISAHDTEDMALPERLHGYCRDAGVEPETIILELTETSAVCQAPHMTDALTRLRRKGFRLSIDDFGTGYSSLAQLERLPFCELKIDRSLVALLLANSGSRVIAEIVTDLARKLSLQTVAEGVEDGDTLRALAEFGCDIAQGYYLSQPLPADRVAPFIREQVPEPLQAALEGRQQAPEPAP